MTNKRQFLQLAKNYTGSESIAGCYVSEKLDGMRALWDGGCTRGMSLDRIPWANTEKDHRLLRQPKSTGLWSRYGKSIQAPDWWLDRLPLCILDGELWMGRGSFQKVMSIARRLVPTDGWEGVSYRVFDCPPARVVFADGVIGETNYKKSFSGIMYSGITFPSEPSVRSLDFATVYAYMKCSPWASLVLQQTQLPFNATHAKAELERLLNDVTSSGGEGLILRTPFSFWVPKRSSYVLKVKGFLDDEATVVGYTAGRMTELGSKLLGLMGALIVSFRGRTFELSGFTDSERELNLIGSGNGSAYSYVSERPGERLDSSIVTSHQFPLGTVITFRYRELTNDGIPKEARYWRKFSE